MSSCVKNFDTWLTNHPEVKPLIKPIKNSKKWAKISCEQITFDQKGLTHRKVYKAIICIDPKSKYAGNIYSPDTKEELQIKFTALAIIGRPVHAICFLAYNILGIAFGVAAYRCAKGEKSISWLAKKTLHSFEDLFRTPYYEAILGGAALVGAVGGVFSRNVQYNCRAFTGRQQSKFFRAKRTDLVGSPCMYRLVNITFFEQKKQKRYTDTTYQDKNNAVLVGLANLARKSPG